MNRTHAITRFAALALVAAGPLFAVAASAEDNMTPESTNQDHMKSDGMKSDSMKSGGMKSGGMKSGGMKSGGMKSDGMKSDGMKSGHTGDDTMGGTQK